MHDNNNNNNNAKREMRTHRLRRVISFDWGREQRDGSGRRPLGAAVTSAPAAAAATAGAPLLLSAEYFQFSGWNRYTAPFMGSPFLFSPLLN